LVFQIWRRDEVVSLKGLAQIDWEAAKKIFWRQMGELIANDYEFNEAADAVGWLFCARGNLLRRENLMRRKLKNSGNFNKNN